MHRRGASERSQKDSSPPHTPLHSQGEPARQGVDLCLDVVTLCGGEEVEDEDQSWSGTVLADQPHEINIADDFHVDSDALT